MKCHAPVRPSAATGAFAVARPFVLVWVLASPGLAQCVLPEDARLPTPVGPAVRELGYAISVSGGTVFAGAPFSDVAGADSGAAWVYTRDASGWGAPAPLLVGDAAAGDFLGVSVAVAGDTALVGAAGNANVSGVGVAYVFGRDGTAWSEEAVLTASDADGLGFSAALCGHTSLVGAPWTSVSGVDPGAAYVFVRVGSTWSQQAQLTAGDGLDGDEFGRALGLAGDTAVVGAFRQLGFRGSAYVFTRSGTIWTEQAKLEPTGGEGGDLFGLSADIDGDTIAIGAEGDDDLGTTTGAVYVFVRDRSDWTEQQKLVAWDAAPFDSFGRSVAVEGERIVVGAANHDAGGANAGALYVFVRVGSTWYPEAKLIASDATNADFLGCSVALSGGRVLAGATGVEDCKGAAYAFELQTTGVTRFCSPKRSSSGCLPAIQAVGTPSVTGADDFCLRAAAVEGGTTGLLVFGLTANPTAFGPGPRALDASPVGARLCVAGAVPTGMQASGGMPGTCAGAFGFHFSQVLISAEGLAAGTTVFAQYLYRDPAHPDGSGIGHTDALQFTLRE